MNLIKRHPEKILKKDDEILATVAVDDHDPNPRRKDGIVTRTTATVV